METTDQTTDPVQEPSTDEAPKAPIHLIKSRFLFVDVSAMRTKQLRRGALSRLVNSDQSKESKKLERIAMEEVRQGLIDYELLEPAESAEES
tara:strand:+ start:218 stop:493 length:276 start_codon:yes stop_codon:yes gene_type:complete